MKKLYLITSLLVYAALSCYHLKAQCVNADFSAGSFSNWTGSWGEQDCDANSPVENVGFVQGPLNDPPSDATTQYHQVICSVAGGNDPNLASMGFTLPMVWPGASYSGRIGNMWQKVRGNDGNGETITYSLPVTLANSVFIYHYAVVLYDGGHATGQQPFFNIKVTDGNGNDIACGDYEIDATTAHTIGGFTSAGNKVYFKNWSSVLLPLVNYIGQTVKVTFTTRGCLPNGCAGSHYAYAYIDAECGPPTLIASSPTICGGSGITLTAPAGAATYTWSGPGVVPPGNTQTVTITQPGAYSVVMTTFGNNPCTYSIDTVVPGNPLSPVTNFSYSPTCVGQATQFTDLSTPLITGWAWDFNNDGVTDATIQNPSYTFPAAGTYPVKLSIVSGTCAADTTINVVVSPAPNSPFTVTGPVCTAINSTITYTGTAPAGSTYTWNFAGGTVASGSGAGPYQVNWSTPGVQNVTLVVTSGACPSPVTTEPVTVYAYPTLTITPDTAICIGSSFTLTAGGATTYTWSPAVTLNDGNTASVIATPSTTTTYSVTGTSNNCSASASTTLTVNPIPTSTFTVVTPVCVNQNSTVTYQGNASSTATYAWNFNGGTASPGGTVQGPQMVQWSSAGTQNVGLTVTQYGCVSPPSTLPVIVNPTPSSAFTAVTPVCIGQASTVVYTGGAGANATYTWGFANGSINTQTGSDSIFVTWTTAGEKDLTLIVTQNNCPSPVTTVPVIVHPIPTAAFTVQTPLCSNANGPVIYTGVSSTVASFAWNFGDSSHVASGSGKGPYEVNWTNSLDNPVTRMVTLTVTDSGCVSPPDTMTLTINPIPPSTPGNPVAYCSGSSATLGTAALPGYTYLWSPTTGLSDPAASNPTVNLPNDSSNMILRQTYTVKTTNLGCSNSASVVVTVNPIPVALYIPPASRCIKNNDLAFTALGSYLPSATFLWNFGPGATPDTSVFPNETVIYNSPGPKPVSLTITQTSTHCSNTFIDTVNIYPTPFVNFSADTLLGCENFDVCFSNYSVSPGSPTYLWNFGDGEASNDSAPCHIYKFPGTYTVNLKVTSDEGCYHDTTQPNLIAVIANPVAEFTASSFEIQQPQTEIDFTNQSYNAIAYWWNFSTLGVYNDTIGSTTDFNTRFNFPTYGLYSVVLTAYNALGCKDTSLRDIIVTPPQNIFIPNVFTPNGDGKNDVVYPEMQEGVTMLWFKIFDRTGEKVHDGLFPWDGTFKGKPCPPAVYVYEAGFNLVDKSVDVTRKGSITLIR